MTTSLARPTHPRKRSGARTAGTLTPSPSRYERKPEEQAAIDAYKARKAEAVPIPLVVASTANGTATLDFDHPDTESGTATGLLMEAFGLTHVPELTLLMHQVTEISQVDGKANATAINQTMALIAGIKPRNTIEAMLATQMASVHCAAMKVGRQLHIGTTLEQKTVNGTVFNKLARTFAMQAETLKRLRSIGDHKVVFEHQHVHVQPGGQAVVGTLNQGIGGGVQDETEGQASLPSTRKPRQSGQREQAGLAYRRR